MDRREAWRIAESVGLDVLARQSDALRALLDSNEEFDVEGFDEVSYHVSVAAWSELRNQNALEVFVTVTDDSLFASFFPTAWMHFVTLKDGP